MNIPITLITDTPAEVCGNKIIPRKKKKPKPTKVPKMPTSSFKSRKKALPSLSNKKTRPSPPIDSRLQKHAAANVFSQAPMPLKLGQIKGTVLKWIHHRGFGFIKPDLEYEQEYFVHYKNIIGGNTLEKGKSVTFELTTRRMKDGVLKPAACNVQGEAVSQQEFIRQPGPTQNQRGGQSGNKRGGRRSGRGGGPNPHPYPGHYGGGPMGPMWYGGSMHSHDSLNMQFPMHVGGGFMPDLPYRAPGTDSYYAHQSLMAQQPTHDADGQTISEAMRRLSVGSAHESRPHTSPPGYPEYAPGMPEGYYKENGAAGSIPPGNGVHMMHPGPHNGYYANAPNGAPEAMMQPGQMQPGQMQHGMSGHYYHNGEWS